MGCLGSLRVSAAAMVKCRLGLDPPEDRGLHWLSPSPGCLRASPSHGALHGVCPAEQPDFLQCPKAPRRKHFQKQEAAAASLLRGWVPDPPLHDSLCIWWFNTSVGWPPLAAQACESWEVRLTGAAFGEQLPHHCCPSCHPLPKAAGPTLGCSLSIPCSP